MPNLTDKQLGYISHHILREIQDQLDQHKESDCDRTIQYAEKWIKENLDIGTASDIIKTWQEGNHEIVLNQLRHLGLNIE